MTGVLEFQREARLLEKSSVSGCLRVNCLI